jgi:hypothetical protein
MLFQNFSVIINNFDTFSTYDFVILIGNYDYDYNYAYHYSYDHD